MKVTALLCTLMAAAAVSASTVPRGEFQVLDTCGAGYGGDQRQSEIGLSRSVRVSELHLKPERAATRNINRVIGQAYILNPHHQCSETLSSAAYDSLTTCLQPLGRCQLSPAAGEPRSDNQSPSTCCLNMKSDEAAEAELPHLLAGRDPQSQNPNDVGTHDYSRPPRAVIFGRGYEPQQVEELKKKFAGIAKEPVAWVRGNPADAPVGAVGPDYAQKVGLDMKRLLNEWRDSGAKDEEILVY
ncbi:hypothetical protein CNMCM5623_000470 [Aspergillus felis]|uniref:Uncharacterized protein n=1 Tax=Aspergillus felis TaxID=1287682 RepID=A0A8H6Q6V6_9EURO|nr:hypothetical protein CNMCM5623_000470 [Aspergillus felis]